MRPGIPSLLLEASACLINVTGWPARGQGPGGAARGRWYLAGSP